MPSYQKLLSVRLEVELLWYRDPMSVQIRVSPLRSLFVCPVRRLTLSTYSASEGAGGL